MPKININELSGIYKKIAELCDIGDKKGILVETGRINEVSIFNKAKKEYDETGNFSINGIKYKTNNGIITLATSNTGSLNNPDNKYPNLVPNFSIDLDKYYSNTIPKDNTNVRNEAVEAQKAYYEYNAQLGNSLANAARRGNIGRHTHHCYRYVTRFLATAGAGQLTGLSAYMAINQLRGDNPEAAKHWKEIPHNNVNPDNLPDVVLVCFDKDDAAFARGRRRPDGYSSEHGHIELCVRNPRTGNFEGFSDGITKNVKFATADAIFIPV